MFLNILLFPFNLILSLAQFLLRRDRPSLERPITGSALEQKLAILEIGYKAAIEEGGGQPLPNGTVLKKMIFRICGECEVPYCNWTLTTYKTQGTKSCTTFSVGDKLSDWAILGSSIEWCEGLCHGLFSSAPGAGDGVYFIKDGTNDEDIKFGDSVIEAFEFEIVENEVAVRRTTDLPKSLLKSLEALSIEKGCNNCLPS